MRITEEISTGTTVQFYNAWYEYTSELNAYGDREVIDVHVSFNAKVLTQHKTEALILNLETLKCSWVLKRYLSLLE